MSVNKSLWLPATLHCLPLSGLVMANNGTICGLITQPRLHFQGKHIYPEAPDLVTFITFGGLSLVAGIFALALPETGDEDLPDTVFEAEHLGEAGKATKSGDFDDNTLVRSEDCGPTQFSEVNKAQFLSTNS